MTALLKQANDKAQADEERGLWRDVYATALMGAAGTEFSRDELVTRAREFADDAVIQYRTVLDSYPSGDPVERPEPTPAPSGKASPQNRPGDAQRNGSKADDSRTRPVGLTRREMETLHGLLNHGESKGLISSGERDHALAILRAYRPGWPPSPLTDLLDALGWSGGTIHEALDAVKAGAAARHVLDGQEADPGHTTEPELEPDEDGMSPVTASLTARNAERLDNLVHWTGGRRSTLMVRALELFHDCYKHARHGEARLVYMTGNLGNSLIADPAERPADKPGSV